MWTWVGVIVADALFGRLQNPRQRLEKKYILCSEHTSRTLKILLGWRDAIQRRDTETCEMSTVVGLSDRSRMEPISSGGGSSKLRRLLWGYILFIKDGSGKLWLSAMDEVEGRRDGKCRTLVCSRAVQQCPINVQDLQTGARVNLAAAGNM
jgi:hypothetical protein